jgi:NADH-quinone oxidoreductase subunit H
MFDITLTAWQILLIKIAVILAIVPAAAIVAGYAEHKVMAHLQHRLGPMYPGGFHGWAILLADGLKFLYKEDIIPAAADRRVFKLVPAVILTPIIMAYLVIPMDRALVIEPLDLGLFYLLAISGIPAIGLIMAGWSSANKYAIIGTFRAAGQFIAYELPIALSAAAIAMLAGSLSLIEIVEAQRWPFVLWPPGLGLALFLIFTISAIAEMTRPPFDMPVAESEIITGPFTEYSGIRFIFSFFLPEVAHMVVLAAVGTTLFLGGYMPIVPWGPLEVIPGFVWFLAKTAFMVFLFLWIRPTFPRLREDQLMTFAWKYLIPATLVLILATGAWILYA